MLRLLALAGLLLAAPPAGAEELIATAHGQYAIRLPEGTGPFPAVMHLHGWGASAAAVFSNTGLTNAILSRGYALIAPQGLAAEGREQRDWGVADGWPGPRDDAEFLADRHSLWLYFHMREAGGRFGGQIWKTSDHLHRSRMIVSVREWRSWELRPEEPALSTSSSVSR